MVRMKKLFSNFFPFSIPPIHALQSGWPMASQIEKGSLSLIRIFPNSAHSFLGTGVAASERGLSWIVAFPCFLSLSLSTPSRVLFFTSSLMVSRRSLPYSEVDLILHICCLLRRTRPVSLPPPRKTRHMCACVCACVCVWSGDVKNLFSDTRCRGTLPVPVHSVWKWSFDSVHSFRMDRTGCRLLESFHSRQSFQAPLPPGGFWGGMEMYQRRTTPHFPAPFSGGWDGYGSPHDRRECVLFVQSRSWSAHIACERITSK